jgi:hypothetical protein
MLLCLPIRSTFVLPAPSAHVRPRLRADCRLLFYVRRVRLPEETSWTRRAPTVASRHRIVIIIVTFFFIFPDPTTDVA